MQDLVTLPPRPRIPVLDDADVCVGAFPVARVICVGRNYADHALEMGGDPEREAPFFFMKPASTVATGDVIPYPGETQALHHEVELVVACDGRRIVACGVGLDLTRRDRQAEAKAERRPWEIGKVFPGAAPCGPLREGSSVLTEAEALIELEVDGEIRQSGRLGQMIHDVPRLLDEIDVRFGIAPGDLLFTGTPAGVGPLLPGQRVVAHVDGLPALHLLVTGDA